MTEANGQAASHDDASPQDRRQRADQWQTRADERERLADERERLADEREALADERDFMAARQERDLSKRRSTRPVVAGGDPSEGADREREEAAMAAVAVRRAEAAVLRAEAELDRARQAAARVRARAALRLAAADRAAVAREDGHAVDPEESAWAADRRDFVATERDAIADQRDETADRRDEAAMRRERVADRRERELLYEERQDRGGDGPRTGHGPATDAEQQRARAAADRRAAADDRARAAHTWGPQEYGPMLLSSFASLARQLFDNDDLPAALARVLKFTVETVGGCDCASVTLVRGGRVVHSVTTGQDAAELDDIQFATGIGPATEAMYGEYPVYVPDLPAAHQWPVLGATAAQLGIASSLSYGLYAKRPAQWSALGTFTLYATTLDAFSPDDLDFGSLLATYIAVAVAAAQREDEVDRREAALHRGLSTRDVIGQAKGILMERQHLTAGEAFDCLRRVSQQLNRKLADVAEHLTETGELPV